MPPQPPQPTLRDWLSVIALGVIWGGTFMLVSVALRGYGPVTIATARVWLGAIALGLLAVAMGRHLPVFTPRLWAHVIPIGILSSALPFSLLSWGQSYVNSAFAGVSMAASPLFVLPLAYFFAAEPLGRNKIIGFGLGLIGTVVLLGPDIASDGPLVLPRLACIAASFCYACASILTRRCPPIDPIVLAAVSLAIGAVLMLPVMLLTEGLPGVAAALPSAALLVLGLVPTAFAVLLRVLVIRSAGSGFMSLTSFQVPVWSVFFGMVVLDEALPLRFFVALALILCGLALSQMRPAARNQ